MVDWTKPIETMDGRAARVLATDIRRGDEFTIAITWPNADGTEGILLASEIGGTRSFPDEPQVRNKSGKREGWINVYRSDDKSRPNDRVVGRMTVFASQDAANDCATIERVACVRVEWEETP